MAFKEEQYKFINLVAPHLSAYAEFMGLLGRDLEKGEIELLFRRTGHLQKFQFEGVIAHARTFMPEWDQAVLKNKILAYNPITSAKYDFRSKPFGGLDSFRILGDYCSQAHALCDHLSLQRDFRVGIVEPPTGQHSKELYYLQGWILGPVRNGLAGHSYLKDNLGKGIGITGNLSYQQGILN